MLLYLLLATASSGDPSVAEPLQVTCIAASVTKRGRFTDSKVAASSGSSTVDQGAVRFLRNMDLSRIYPKTIDPQSGYLVVTTDEKGTVTVQFSGQLLDSCPTPANDT